VISSDSDSCICVLGWHFHDIEFYSQLDQIPNTTLYTVSHRPRADVPRWLEELTGKDRVFYEPNVGYDWGGYQQFLEKGLWRDFKFIFFMHDDLIVKDTGFVTECQRRLREYAVVGNGAQQESPFVPNRNPQRYSHATEIPHKEDSHPGVRGSFVATTRSSLEAVGSFEVFWDRFHISDVFGNHSLVATFHKWKHRAGSEHFCDWLSDTYCESSWITEFQRGQSGDLHQAIDVSKYTPKYYSKKVLRKLLLTVCKWKTQAVWSQGRKGLAYRMWNTIEDFFARRG